MNEHDTLVSAIQNAIEPYRRQRRHLTGWFVEAVLNTIYEQYELIEDYTGENPVERITDTGQMVEVRQ